MIRRQPTSLRTRRLFGFAATGYKGLKIEIIIGELFFQTFFIQQVIDGTALGQINFGHLNRGILRVVRIGLDKFILKVHCFFASTHNVNSRLKSAFGAPYNDISGTGKKVFFNQQPTAGNSLSIVRGLVFVFAQVFDATGAAAGFARLAYIAPMQDQPVVRVEQVRLGDKLQ